MLGYTIAGAALVAVVLAVVLWDKRLILLTVILAVLSAAVQRATTTTGHPWIAGFHAVSGLAILGIAARSPTSRGAIVAWAETAV